MKCLTRSTRGNYLALGRRQKLARDQHAYLIGASAMKGKCFIRLRPGEGRWGLDAHHGEGVEGGEDANDQSKF
jgi:hypothetical protein